MAAGGGWRRAGPALLESGVALASLPTVVVTGWAPVTPRGGEQRGGRSSPASSHLEPLVTDLAPATHVGCSPRQSFNQSASYENSSKLPIFDALYLGPLESQQRLASHWG